MASLKFGTQQMEEPLGLKFQEPIFQIQLPENMALLIYIANKAQLIIGLVLKKEEFIVQLMLASHGTQLHLEQSLQQLLN